MPADPKDWTPDQPLPDADAEEEAQEVARRKARADHLYSTYTKPKEDPAPPKKKRFLER